MSANSYKNDIYESSSPTLSLKDDQCSLIDEGFWHDNDLVLAAELGKALLDRNRKLELALEKSKSIEREKNAEIEFLIKELTNLRELSQRKMAFVDEADRYNQELDNSNRQLMRKISEDQQKIQRLSNTIASLEDQVAGLVERLKKCDSQSMNGEKESPHSPHHRRFVRNSPLSTSTSSAAVSPRKISGTVNANTKDTLSRNSNTFAIRNWSKSPYLNKDRGYFRYKSKTKHIYAMNRKYSSQRNTSTRGCREKGGLFFIDDELFDQPEIGIGLHHDHHRPQSSMLIKMKPDKCYSQLFRDVSILPHWMVQNERQYSRTQNDYDDNDDDDDDCGDYSLGTSRMQLYRTFSWPRMNSEVSYDRFEEPMDLCYPQSNDENSFQYSLNEDNVGSLQKENLENRDTPTTIKENGKYQESSNKEQVYQSSESVVLSNSLIKMDSKRNQHVHQQSPEGTRISDKNNDNELDDEKDSSDSGLLDISTANSIQVENKVKPRVSDQINDLLDDINFVSCLDRIYNPHIRSQYQDLINSDYKPEYRQLFCEAFNLIKSIRSGKPYKLS